MKSDAKWRQLRARSRIATKALDEALAPILRKLSAYRDGESLARSLPREDTRLQTAVDAWKDINDEIARFITDDVGRR